LACRIATGSEKHLLYLINALGCANERLSNTGISGRFSLRPVIVDKPDEDLVKAINLKNDTFLVSE